MAPDELWNFLLVCRREGLVKFCFSDAEMLSKIKVLTEDMPLFNTSQQPDSQTGTREEDKEEDIVEESISQQPTNIISEGEEAEHTSSSHPSLYSSFPSPYSSFSSDSEPHPPTTPTLNNCDSVINTSFLSAPVSPVHRIQFSPETSKDDNTREDDISVQDPLPDDHNASFIDQEEEEQQEVAVVSDREPTDDELELVEESDNETEGDETASLEEERCVMPSPPLSSASAAIVLSSDDEDTNLENMFADLRLQSARKEAAAKRVVSRKSLDMFIVSDSEELSEEEHDEKENQSPHHQQQRPPYMFDDSPCYTPVTYTPPACSTPAYLYTPKRMPSVATVSTVHTPSATKSVRHYRYKMATELYQLFNKTVFDGKLPEEIELVWNNRLRTTAGFCSYSGLKNRRVKIELSTKVCDTYERIRDTLIHEMCHAANWIIDGTRRAGHGTLWKAWAKKANTVHPDINTIDRCHSYEISYKYSYKCTVCDFKIGRHSKSINLETARCPYCANCLELCY